jgi:ubiquitin-protein ligase
MPREGQGSQPSPLEDPFDTEVASDYKIALRLHEEMNGSQSKLPNPISEYNSADMNYDADFALAVQMQYNDSLEAQAAENNTYVPPQEHVPARKSRWDTPALCAPHPSAREAATEQGDSDSAVYGLDGPYTPDSRSFSSLVDFTAHVKLQKCARCRKLLIRSKECVTDMLEKFENEKSVLMSRITCRNCGASSCIACNSDLPAHHSTVKINGKRISWCCSGGRLFLVWILLCGFDQHFLASKTTQEGRNNGKEAQGGASRKAKKAVRTNKTQQQHRGRGVGFGGGGGSPYFSELDDFETYDYVDDEEEEEHRLPSFKDVFMRKRQRHGSHTHRPSDRIRAQRAQKTDDTFNTLILKLLNAVLPSLNRVQGFDTKPPGLVSSMLSESKILNYCAELLRNDSLDDASKRHVLYNALITFIQTIGLHNSTSGLVFNELPVRPDTVNIIALSFQKPPEVPSETTSSLVQGLRNLTTQSNLLLKGAQTHSRDFETTDGKQLLVLCRRISALSQMLNDDDREASAHQTARSTEEMTTCAITDVPDEEILATHTYVGLARALNTAPHGRMKRLITEITTLNTGLPPGIFVRYGSERPDILSAIIIGPSGTPYENGIFEFDFFCDASYPHQPPKVSFRTTGGGRASFNPNLYPCGKVCLSLLGTWSGEPWKPGESTLLQILISLQAMILCEEPWYNEPGRENNVEHGQQNYRSVSYNQQVRRLTVCYAMLTWLHLPSPLWKDVVIEHFTKNGNKILETVSEWVTEKPALPVNGAFHDNVDDGYRGFPRQSLETLLPELQTALRKHGATFVVPGISPTATSKPTPPSRIAPPAPWLHLTPSPPLDPPSPFYTIAPLPPPPPPPPMTQPPSYSLPPPPAYPPVYMSQPAPPSVYVPSYLAQPGPHPAIPGDSFNMPTGMGRGNWHNRGAISSVPTRGGYGSEAAAPRGGGGSSAAGPPFGGPTLGTSEPAANPRSRTSSFMGAIERMHGGFNALAARGGRVGRGCRVLPGGRGGLGNGGGRGRGRGGRGGL